MKKRCTVLLRWLALVALALMAISTSIEAGAPTAGSATVKPTGELRIASAFLGAQRLIPWAEVPSGGIKQPLLLIYDTLVGCTDDGKIAAESGVCGTLGRSF